MQQVPTRTHSLRLILPFFIVIIIDAMSIGMIAPILAPLVYQPSGILAGFSLATRHLLFGLMLGLGPLCFMLGAPVLGHWSDKFGRKAILLCCILGTLVSFICYFCAFKFTILGLVFVGRVIDGLTSGSQGVAQAAIADISHGKQKAANIGFIAVAMTIGLVIGPFIGGVFSDHTVVSWFNNTTPFLLAIVLNLINIFIFLKYLKETKQTPPQTTRFFSQFKQTLRQKRLCMMIVSFFLFECAWSLYFQSLNLNLVKQFHASKHLLGIFSLYIGIVLSLGLLLLVRWAIKRFALFSIVSSNQFIMGLAFLGLLCLPFMAAQWLFGAVIALAVALIYACLIASLSDAVSKDNQGFLLGLTDGVLALAFAISGFLSGPLMYVNAQAPTWVCFGCMLLAVILLYLSKENTRYSFNTEKTINNCR